MEHVRTCTHLHEHVSPLQRNNAGEISLLFYFNQSEMMLLLLLLCVREYYIAWDSEGEEEGEKHIRLTLILAPTLTGVAATAILLSLP